MYLTRKTVNANSITYPLEPILMTKVVSPSGVGVLTRPVSLVIGPLAYNTTMNLEAMPMSMISNNLDLAVSLLERIGFSSVLSKLFNKFI